MKKVLSVLLMFLSFFILISCKGDVGIKEGTVDLTVGGSGVVELKGLKPEKVKFESGNEDVVLIDEAGKFKGIAPGLSTITVTYKKQEWSLFVIVTGDKIVIEAASDISIEIGNSLLLSYESNDPNGVTFKSNDEEILTISDVGLIETLKPGLTEVVITSNTNLNISKTVTVRVLDLEEASYNISLKVLSLNINRGETTKIEVVTDDPAGVTFKSNDEDILVVDEEGNIEALEEGVVAVVITSKTNKNISKTLMVTVIDNRSLAEKNFEKAIFNTVNLSNYTLSFDVKENFENKNYYYTILLMFDGNLTKLKANQIEEYYEVIDDKQYAYIRTDEGFIKEEVESNIDEGFLFYENFTYDAFIYNDFTNEYSLDGTKPEHAGLLDDFINLFAEEGIILLFKLTINDEFIEMMEFMFVYDEFVFEIKISLTDIENTLVEVPEHA